jgi:hypothetical protein
MKMSYTYDGESVDEIMETHYLEMQANLMTDKEMQREIFRLTDALDRQTTYTKHLQERVGYLTNLNYGVL